MKSKFQPVNVVEQCGLEIPENSSFEMRNGYLGKIHDIKSSVGRFSQPLSWTDTHIMIHSNIKPIATPITQKFLEEATENSENSNLIYHKHPFIHITYPQRLIKERNPNNTKIFSYSGEKEQYYFNKEYLNDESIAYSHSNNRNKFNSRFYIQNSDSFSLNFDKKPKKRRSSSTTSPKSVSPPNLNSANISPRNKNKNRLKKKRKSITNKPEEFSTFNLNRRISLQSIIQRENTHIPEDNHNTIYFAQRSSLPFSRNTTLDSFSTCYDDDFDEIYNE